MDWKGQMAMTGDMLDRIVVLLLAIADLAERAAGAPEARRRLVLAIIRSGDAVARDFVRAPAAGDWQRAPASTVPCSGQDPEDPMALAMSLRALALILRSLGARIRRLSSLATGEVWQRAAYILRFADMAFLPAQRLDTS